MKRRLGIRQLVGDPIPGRIGEAWSGVALNGHHINAVLDAAEGPRRGGYVGR
jgi:hypothetical protein